MVKIVGILNVTPDSFYDGGKFLGVEDAVRRAKEMIDEGADIIDIGGESTGPNSREVSADEELKRILPVVRQLRKKFPHIPLSVDTYKSVIAEAVLKEGVRFINDVTAGRSDSKMFETVARAGAYIILTYSKDDSPRTTINNLQYDDVMETLIRFFEGRTALAMQAGIPKDHIIIDPGLGHFVSSDAKYSFQILSDLKKLQALGHQIFVSPSRKSFLAGPENLPASKRLAGTIAASLQAAHNGASYVRTHDVGALTQALSTKQPDTPRS